MQKTILCLANSWRPGGHCVAGKETANGRRFGAWIRPIDPNQRNAITDAQMRYGDGTHADVLDLVRLQLTIAMPEGHQTENYVVDSSKRWVRVGRASWADVIRATDAVAGPLWNVGDSSYHGVNDKVSEIRAEGLGSSLLLIEPSNLELVVGSESRYGGGTQRRVRARFELNGHPYNFVVTDFVVGDEYLAQGDGTYPIAEARLCVSLAEVVGDSATKLVAAVITPERAE